MKNLYILLACCMLFSLDMAAQSYQWQWAKSAVEPNNANTTGFVRDVSTDRQGNVLATGFFYSDSITFGSFTLRNAGIPGFTENIFTVKYDASGNVLWAIGAGGKRFDFPAAVRTDGYGNVYVAGGFYSDSAFFSGHALYNYGPTDTTCDGFVVKYDPNGNFIWAKSFGGNYYDGANGMTVDARGNVFVAGYYQSDSIIVGSATLHDAAGYRDHNSLLIKMDSAGDILWARNSLNLTGGVEAYSVSTDPAGNSFLAGRFAGSSSSFGTHTVISQTSNYNDAFLVKYDPSGTALWAQSAGGSLSDLAYAVAADPSGNSYITGYFNSATANFGTQQLVNDTTDGSGDIFLAKYDPTGALLWTKGFGGDRSDVPKALIADSSSVYMTGYYYSPQFVIGDTLTNFDNSGVTDDVFIARFDLNGNPMYSASVGGLSYDAAYGVAADASGSIYTGGFFRSDDIAFGSTSLFNSTHTHNDNPFVAKYISLPNGIASVSLNTEIMLYPNPASNMITARSESFRSHDVSAVVYDITGNVIPLQYLYASDQIQFNTANLAAGSYVIQFTAGGSESRARFIKIEAVR